jgi:hypothetical protein
MPVLWRAHDRHRDLRARLPAELAADTDQDRHLMSQTFCERCRFPAPMRWLNAGGDRSRSNSIHQCVHRALTRSKHPSKCLLHSAHLPYMRTRRSNPVSIPPIIELGASIKSP